MDANEYEDYAKQHPEVARRREQIRDELRRACQQLRESIERSRGIEPLRIPLNAEYLRNPYTLSRPPQALAEGFHGRWENLSLSDMQLLHKLAISID